MLYAALEGGLRWLTWSVAAMLPLCGMRATPVDSSLQADAVCPTAHLRLDMTHRDYVNFMVTLTLAKCYGLKVLSLQIPMLMPSASVMA